MRRPRRDVGEGVRATLSMLLIAAGGTALLPRSASSWQSTIAGITGDSINPAQGLGVVRTPTTSSWVGSNHFVIVKLAAATAPRAVNDFVVRNRTNRFVAEGN